MMHIFQNFTSSPTLCCCLYYCVCVKKLVCFDWGQSRSHDQVEVRKKCRTGKVCWEVGRINLTKIKITVGKPACRAERVKDLKPVLGTCASFRATA